MFYCIKGVILVSNFDDSLSDGRRSRPPALSVGEQEARMVGLAMSLVEKRMRDGTASPTETVHFLKLGSRLGELELKKLETQIELNKANAQQEVDFKAAIEAMSLYSGRDLPDEA